MIDNVQAYIREKKCISQSLNTRLDLTESSLLGAQQVTVAMVQLTTEIPDNSPHSTEVSESDNNDYQDDREYHIYKLDGTTDRLTPTDQSTDDEDIESDNNT